MSRVGSVILAILVVLALLVALDPRARAKADEVAQDFKATWRSWGNVQVAPIPVTGSDDQTSVATPTPVPTPVVNSDDDNEDSSGEPVIIINWDALRDSLRKIWENLNARLNNDLRNNK